MSNKYQIDPSHSSASFSIKHMMIAKVNGGFEKISGAVAYDPQNPSGSSVEVTIDASSINTREDKRDEHLKSPDFFDVAKFPTITFKSSKIVKSSDGLQVVGDLSIHGVTKQVTLEVEGPTDELKDPYGNMRIGASATTKIKRKDFGLSWNAALESGGVLVGDDVNITLDVQLIRQK